MFAPRVITITRRMLSIAGMAASVALALIVANCGATTSESVVGPGLAKCGVTLSTSDSPVDARGATSTVIVTTTPECAWTATADVAWISDVTPASGQGSAQVQFRAAANPILAAREGGITVNNQRAIVRQAAGTCQIGLTANDVVFAAGGGTATITVTARDTCAWTASSSASWITLTPPVSGSGDGTLRVTIAQNTGAARSGTIFVGNGDLTLSQIGATGQPASTCGISIQPTSVSMPAAGGGSAVAVTTDPGCAWTALSQAPWITMTPPASGSGSGSAAFTVAANASTNARSGTITIGGATLTVNQAAACAPATINPSSQSFAGGGGAGTPVTVTAAAGCGWISTSNAPWLTITAGASGTGNGTVGFSVAPNTTTNRTGTLTIASQTFTVNQTACTFEIDRTAQTIGSDGGAGFPIPVRTQAGCPWTSTANVNWLHITSGATGIGNDNVTFIVDSSGNESRVGTLTVAGLTSIVSQERCTATVTPGINPVSSSGGSFSVTIATQTGCRWDATSDAAWLIPDETSGIGERTVTYRVLPNPGGARTGRLTFVVSGDQETLTVTQGN